MSTRRHTNWAYPVFLVVMFFAFAALTTWGYDKTYGNPASAQQVAACRDAGGRSVETKVTFNGHWYDTSHSGTIFACQQQDGTWSSVWNKVIDPNTTPHWYGTSHSKVAFAQRCAASGGTAYDTKYSSGKHTHHVAVCVTNGRVTDHLS